MLKGTEQEIVHSHPHPHFQDINKPAVFGIQESRVESRHKEGAPQPVRGLPSKLAVLLALWDSAKKETGECTLIRIVVRSKLLMNVVLSQDDDFD